MNALRRENRAGLDYMEAATELLQRIRRTHPTAGLYEAADLQWWWGQRSRPTDELPQLFWFDESGQPVAAVILTVGGAATQLDPILPPGASPELVAVVIGSGLAHANELGFDTISLEVDPADEALRAALVGHGLAIEEGGIVESWLAVENRPPVSPLPAGYRLTSRAEAGTRPHHMISVERDHPDPEARLRQTSLYRGDLDLVVYDSKDCVAAYGLFWHDPTSGTGLVEPMRTEDAHQRRGLARHVLTAGVHLLAAAGAARIKICFDPDNPASSNLYLDVGFQPHRVTINFSGPTVASGVGVKGSQAPLTSTDSKPL